MMFSSYQIRWTLVFGAITVAVVLSGCGGNGAGGMAAGGNGGGMNSSTLNSVLTDATIRAGAEEAIKKAGGADPNAGSITQSSNTNNDGITTDQVKVTAEYGTTPRFSVTNGDKWSIGMNEGNPRALQGLDSPWKGAQLNKKISGGTLYVNVYTDIKAPTTVPSGPQTVGSGDVVTGWTTLSRGTRQPGTLNGVPGTFLCAQTGCSVGYSGSIRFGTNIPRTVGSASGVTFTPTEGRSQTRTDTDYLAGGVWLFVPDTASSTDDYVLGAFGDGSDPFRQDNIMALTGTARYQGDATGIYSEKEASSTTIGTFDGDVTLTANFGAADSLGTINGSIGNLEVDGETTMGSLTLGAAPIGSTNSGFFKGAVSGSVSGEGGSRTLSGKWGGQFFGNGAASTDHPGSVGGTFGGKSTDDAVNFVGAFGAFKQ